MHNGTTKFEKNKWTEQAQKEKMVESKARELTLELTQKSENEEPILCGARTTAISKEKNVQPSRPELFSSIKQEWERFSENYKGGDATKPCPFCKEQNAVDTQQHSLSFIVIKENIQQNVNYDEIFFSEVEVKTAKTLKSILKFREEYFDL